MKINLPKIILVSGLSLFYACSSAPTTEETATDPLKDTSSNTKTGNAQVVLYNLPSPMETSQLLRDAGAKFDGTFMNKSSNSKEYKTSEIQALNLGVYGADLSYAGIFENSQECMSLLKAINGLCAELGINGAFNETTAERIEKNKNNKDSLVEIISSSFWEADGSLKENNRTGISSLLIAGGWIEGMYLATKVYEKTKSEKIKSRLINEPQLNALKNIIAMLENEKNIVSAQPALLEGMKNLRSSYEKISFGKSETKFVTDEKSHKTKLETTSDVKVSDEQFKAVVNAVVNLRNTIVAVK